MNYSDLNQKKSSFRVKNGIYPNAVYNLSMTKDEFNSWSGENATLRSFADLTSIAGMSVRNNPWYAPDTLAYVDENNDIKYLASG